MAQVDLKSVRKSFGPVRVIDGLNLHIPDGAFTVFVGPSGCGKSTLLRLIAGLEELSGGDIEIGARNVNKAGPIERGVAMVFQNYALYPHMTVEQNIGFSLRMARVAWAEIVDRVAAAARSLQVGELLRRKPAQLSGGQRQRVAIGRAIVRDPEVFLFDEPLSNLDAELRVSMRVEIAKLHQQLGATMIYVTHDQTEAMTLADQIVVMRAGNIEQVGSPQQLYEDPDNLFVAGFIGSPRMNFMKAALSGGAAALAAGARLPAPGLADAADVLVGLRPEHFVVGAPAEPAFDFKVDVVEYLGGTRYLHGAATSGETLVVEARDALQVRPGDIVRIGAPAGRALLFAASGARLRAGRMTAADLSLWRREPAREWTEAYPLGNGRLGAMVFGGIAREQLQINEATLWTGGPYEPINPEALPHLDEIRRLIFEGRYAEAEALANRHAMARPLLQMSYQPACDLWLDFAHDEATDYSCRLDLDRALTTVSYVAGGVRFVREAFISPLDQVLVLRVRADRPGALSASVRLSQRTARQGPRDRARRPQLCRNQPSGPRNRRSAALCRSGQGAAPRRAPRRAIRSAERRRRGRTACPSRRGHQLQAFRRCRRRSRRACGRAARRRGEQSPSPHCR